MPMSAETLQSLLARAFPQAQITLTDLVGDDNHWRVEIIDEGFRGKPRPAQHQMVYAALDGAMDGPDGVLHALSITTRAPD